MGECQAEGAPDVPSGCCSVGSATGDAPGNISHDKAEIMFEFVVLVGWTCLQPLAVGKWRRIWSEKSWLFMAKEREQQSARVLVVPDVNMVFKVKSLVQEIWASQRRR